MNFLELQQQAMSAYETVSTWVFHHPFRTDAIVVTGIVSVLAGVLTLRQKKLRRARRIRWGKWMTRSKNREAYEKSLISYGICDAIEEAVYRGDMNRQRADYWYHSFANYYQMTELLPTKNKETVKRSIRYRLNKQVHKIKAIIPGPKPEVKVDKTYVPDLTVAKIGTRKSKYVTAA